METVLFSFGIGFFGLRFLIDLFQKGWFMAIYTGSATAICGYALWVN